MSVLISTHLNVLCIVGRYIIGTILNTYVTRIIGNRYYVKSLNESTALNLSILLLNYNNIITYTVNKRHPRRPHKVIIKQL